MTEANETLSRRLAVLADQLTGLLREPVGPHGDADWLLRRCKDTAAMSGDLKLASMRELERDVARFNEEFPAFGLRFPDPVFVAERLVWRFHKSGDVGNDTIPFASFAKGIRDAIASQIDAGPHEVPVVLHHVSDDSWECSRPSGCCGACPLPGSSRSHSLASLSSRRTCGPTSALDRKPSRPRFASSRRTARSIASGWSRATRVMGPERDPCGPSVMEAHSAPL
jgi:hypothetical protein